jgi:histidinol-phosphate aminotransferase
MRVESSFDQLFSSSPTTSRIHSDPLDRLARMPTSKPSHFKLEQAIRSNILALSPYRCARDDYNEGILLDANENSLGHALPTDDSTDSTYTPPVTLWTLSDATFYSTASFDSLNLNRYPSPTHDDVKQLLCKLRKVPSPANFFLGVGSDEAIDLLFRITCTPGKDRVLVCPPTYGMYGVCAQINDVEVVKVPLDVEGGKFLPKVDEVNRPPFDFFTRGH